MEFTDLVRRQRAYFETGATRPVAFRLAQLEALTSALERHENRLLAALQADLHKSPFQGYASELGVLHAEIRHARKKLPRWVTPVKRPVPWLVAPARGWAQPEPFGVVLILGPWNYPLQLLLTPLVSAIAAGNCTVLKPSELAPRTAEAVTTLINETFAEQFISVVTGGANTAQALLRERFDKIFFTGSPRVGRQVMAVAAQHLTPVTLELGGKCPVIVCADAAIEQAARRIAWGKFLNAGQTCVAPDFVLAHRSVAKTFVNALKQAVHDFYGRDISASSDYGRIVNTQHFARLADYLADGQIAFGGEQKADELYLAPTILTDVSPDSAVMQEEIFGPILPVLEFDRLEEVFTLLRQRPTPLALYAFTRQRETEARIMAETRSGGASVNDVVSHILCTGLPFGGLGESGMGAYHGRAGFDAFSHQKAILRRVTWLDLPFRYPPQKISLASLKRAMRFLLRG